MSDQDMLIQWIFKNIQTNYKVGDNKVVQVDLIKIGNVSRSDIKNGVKVFVNGLLIGYTNQPMLFKMNILNSAIKSYTNTISVCFDIHDKYIQIYCDEGRMMRPLLFLSNGTMNYFEQPDVFDMIRNGQFTWNQCIYGFGDSKNGSYNSRFIDLDPKFINDKSVYQKRSIIEYIDKNEEESAYVDRCQII